MTSTTDDARNLTPDASTFRHELPRLIAHLIPPFAVAAVGGRTTVESVRTWYPRLEKPPFSPPNAIFGPIWSLLYLLMGIADWRVAQADDDALASAERRDAIAGAQRIYRIQLVLNALWTWLFFGRRSPLFALVDILALWVAIVLTIIRFRKVSRLAAALLLPYLAWTTFATALNIEIWRRNR